jgi:uncharacterized protein YidB (DUF937 family)
MELMDMLKMGATLIEGNDDQATTGLDITKIAEALSSLISNNEGGLDLAALVSGLSQNGLGDIVGSWLGNGENKAIAPDDVTVLLGEDKVDIFAKELGIDLNSAKKALADSLPHVIDRATTGEHSIIEEMMGGSGKNAMDMLGKMFR